LPDKFNSRSIVKRSLRYYWKSNIALVLGVAIGTAVLAGSLVVGDSVRASLRKISLARLCGVDYALVSGRFFRAKIADEIYRKPNCENLFSGIYPAVYVRGALTNDKASITVPSINVYGVANGFLNTAGESVGGLFQRDIAVNQRVARELGITEGDAVFLNLARRGSGPADSLFGRKSRNDTISSMRLIVKRIIPGKGLGEFDITGNTVNPRNIYVSLAWLQRSMKIEGKANALFASSLDPSASEDGRGKILVVELKSLADALKSVMTLDDYGLKLLVDSERKTAALESTRMVLEPEVIKAFGKCARENGFSYAPVSVYLANSISLKNGRKEIPYSIVAGIDPKSKACGPMEFAEGGDSRDLKNKGLWLNKWAADDLGAKVGNDIVMEYFVTGSRGRLSVSHKTFKLRGIARMKGAAVDRRFAPDFEGITDAATMDRWEPPFDIDTNKIRPKDEDYWEKYRTAPKAFISYISAYNLWHSRQASETVDEELFRRGGWITSIRMTPAGKVDIKEAVEGVSRSLLRELSPENFGLIFVTVREEAIAAAKGSTDFSALFLGMSMFLIASAACLVALLMRLAIERRASQFGIMSATGFTHREAGRVLLREGVILACVGCVFGILAGIGYARLILYGLGTVWNDVVGGFPITISLSWGAIGVGGIAGFFVAMLAIKWALRLLRFSPTLILLGGWKAIAVKGRKHLRLCAIIIGVSLTVGAILLVLSSLLIKSLSSVGVFFGGGAALLLGIIALVYAWLQPAAGKKKKPIVNFASLAWRSAARNRLRSILTVALMACASFIIVTVAANRTDLRRLDTKNKSSGAGGFNMMATSDLPLFHDFNSENGRKAMGFTGDENAIMATAKVFSFRLKAGNDASCLNLRRPTSPRILGAPDDFISRGGFAFSGALPEGAGEKAKENPWELLNTDLSQSADKPEDRTRETVIPAIADGASAQWILHKSLGDDILMTDKRGERIRLRLVAFLAGSIFAGELVISENNFIRHFNAEDGYRFFLIDSPPANENEIIEKFTGNLGELGFNIERTRETLARYSSVQNAYLGAFQTLGGFGLLLGTFGIVAVLLRGIIERKSELAMLSALGFRRKSIFGIILLENGMLLICGMVTGAIASLLAVAPQLASSLADVQWMSLAATLLACIFVGLFCCAFAAALSLRGKLLAALRSE